MISQFNYFKGIIFNHEEQLVIYLIENSEELRSLLRTNPTSFVTVMKAIWKNYSNGLTDIETISMLGHLHEKRLLRQYKNKKIDEKTI